MGRPKGSKNGVHRYIPRICNICGKEFNGRPHDIAKGYSKFCSKPCRDIGISRPKRFGKDAPCWKGGSYEHEGYVWIYSPKHPFCSKKKYVKRARLVMEKHLGHYLKPSEVVHHINSIKNDDRIENLKLFETHSEHIKYHCSLRKRDEKGLLVSCNM